MSGQDQQPEQDAAALARRGQRGRPQHECESVLQFGSAQLTFQTKKLLGGPLSIVAADAPYRPASEGGLPGRYSGLLRRARCGGADRQGDQRPCGQQDGEGRVAGGEGRQGGGTGDEQGAAGVAEFAAQLG